MSRNLKLKVLGLGVLAAFAVSGMAVMNASATTGGHFTSDVEHTTLHGVDHNKEVHWIDPHLGNTTISCKEATYSGTTSSATVTDVTIKPSYKTGKCFDGEREVHIDMNECQYRLTIGKKAHEDNTVHLVCPGKGPELTVTGPLGTCNITVTPNQTPQGGVAYTTGGSGNTHDITADITIKGIHVIYDGGFFICGGADGTTSNVAELTGEVTVGGFKPEGSQVGITATGSEGT